MPDPLLNQTGAETESSSNIDEQAEHTLHDELEGFSERFPKIGDLLKKAAKYFDK